MAAKKKLQAHTVKNSCATISQLMRPQDQNFLGFIFGGVILSLMDQIAYISARRHCSSNCVTAAFDAIDFKDHIYVGELLTLNASVNYAGTTSMEVGIKVFAENLKDNTTRHVTSGYVTMVAVDDKGKPRKIPPLLPETPDEKRRFKEGEKRYNERKKRQ